MLVGRHKLLVGAILWKHALQLVFGVLTENKRIIICAVDNPRETRLGK
jgi:hypothetical protein